MGNYQHVMKHTACNSISTNIVDRHTVNCKRFPYNVCRMAAMGLAVVTLTAVVIYLLFISDACMLSIWCNLTGAKEVEDA